VKDENNSRQSPTNMPPPTPHEYRHVQTNKQGSKYKLSEQVLNCKDHHNTKRQMDLFFYHLAK